MISLLQTSRSEDVAVKSNLPLSCLRGAVPCSATTPPSSSPQSRADLRTFSNFIALMMPARLFGLRRHSFQKTDDNATANKSEISPSVTEIRRPSMDHIKRPSLTGLRKQHGSSDKASSRNSSKDKSRDASRASALPKPVRLDMIIESPPALFLDAPQQSSGALISGRLQVSPVAGDVIMNSIVMYLECTTSTKKPVEPRCRECMYSVVDLFETNFLSKPKTFTASEGMQELPFSYLVPGHLPATTHGQIGSIDYSLHVRAKSSDGHETEYRRDLVIQRALRPGNDKNSMRIFPPTNLTLHVTLPSIVHPIGDFPVICRMTGITTKNEDSHTRWRLRKLAWRIEEKETMVSPACSKHAAKVGGEGKGVQHEHSREIGGDELKHGWKTDFSDGQIEGEFTAAIDTSKNPQCDMDAANGMKISHILIMELVVSEEWAPNKKPSQATPTGAARVLRTQFNLNLTQRLGLGISWDDEMPPMYEDVPASPPHYQNDDLTHVRDYDGDDLHADIEHLTLNQ